MNTEELAALVATLQRAGVSELTYRDGPEVLTLRFVGATESAAEATAKPASSSSLAEGSPAKQLKVFANATGSFSRMHPLATDLPTKQVRRGDHVGYLTVESVVSAITAPTDGIATSQLMEDGETAGYGQAVLELLEL